MKISEAIRNKDGFTLMEIIISIAILGIITTLGFAIFSYNTKIFGKSSVEMKEQSSLRLAAYKLTNEFRNIGYIDLDIVSFTSSAGIAAELASDPLHADDCFVFKPGSGSGIKKGSATAISDISDTEIEDVSFVLSKKVYNHVTTYYLEIMLTGKTGEKYTTEVLLNNIITDDSIQMDSSDIGALTVFHSIQYNYEKPPED